MVSKNVERYLRQVRILLPCRRTARKLILDQVRSNLNQFVEDDPSADYESIVRRFGSPRQIAATYIDEMDTDELLSDLRIKHRIVGMVSFAVAMGLVICLVTAGLVYLEGVDNVNGAIETYIYEYNVTTYLEEK